MYGWMHLRTGEETGRLTDYGRITNRRTDGQAGRQRTDIWTGVCTDGRASI